MAASDAKAGPESGRVLDPVERLSEILFGLIMALTFTGSIHAASDGHEEIRTALVGAIGCNVAWGIVDAVMYLMTGLVTRGRALRALRNVRRAATHEEAAAILADALPEGVVKVMAPRDFESLRGWIAKLPEQPTRVVTARDLRGAFGVFVLVTVSTFPMVVPFLFASDAVRALRLSHGIALTMLFLIGWALGKYGGLRPLLTGLSMLGIGVVLALLAIALGG
jgi:VIT1/CCC1 family predicted Fe2+/Mn2+ transporter